MKGALIRPDGSIVEGSAAPATVLSDAAGERRKLRILYVVGLWPGVRELVFGGHAEPGSVPALINPLRLLIDEGHEVDIVVAAPDDRERVHVGASWLAGARVTIMRWSASGRGRARSAVDALGITRRLVRMIREGRYDFVYGHGSFGALANLAALRARVPVGLRLYGTQLAPEMRARSRLRVALSHPFEWLSFALPKSFLLATDDNQCADEVHAGLAPRARYVFHFWPNGVDAMPPARRVGRGRTIFYPASIVPWKRQELAVDVLSRVHEAGHRDVRLILAGRVLDTAYFHRVQALIREKNLDHSVDVVGLLSPEEMADRYASTGVYLTMHAVSNMGNGLIEALAHGCAVVALDDGIRSLDRVITDKQDGCLVRDASEASRAVARLLADPDETRRMGEAAAQRAAASFKPWRERARDEVALIYKAAAHGGP